MKKNKNLVKKRKLNDENTPPKDPETDATIRAKVGELESKIKINHELILEGNKNLCSELKSKKASVILNVF